MPINEDAAKRIGESMSKPNENAKGTLSAMWDRMKRLASGENAPAQAASPSPKPKAEEKDY